MKFKLKAYSIQEFGQRKDAQGNPHQEDSIYPLHGKQTDADRLFILCDGMGGHDAGEVASATVCEAMSQSVNASVPNSEALFTDDMLLKAVDDAFHALDQKDNGASKKMGTTILVASIAIWGLSYFPHDASLSEEEQIEMSYIGQIGKWIEPVLQPCGMEWKEGVALITGVGAKEIVASTMAVLYQGDFSQSGISPLSAFCLMVFVLLYMPCIATCISIKNESGQWKWALFTAAYTTALAWVVTTVIFQIGSLI